MKHDDLEPADDADLEEVEPVEATALETPPAEPAPEAEAETVDVPHRAVEAEIAFAGKPPTGELVVGEFAGSVDRVEDLDGAPLEFTAEEVGVGVTRLRVSGTVEGDVAVRILVVA